MTAISFSNILMEAFYGALLMIWVMFVVAILAKKLYEYVEPKRSARSAVYFSRKLIHFLAGGLVAILVPYLFKSPLIPDIMVVTLTIVTYYPHKTGNLMYWFQVEGNMAEVYFVIMWGIIITVAWPFNVWLGVIPVLFMAWGDGITGIVRNLLYYKRTKAWIGNIAMFTLCAPLGWYYFGIYGLIAAAIASIVEHYEFIDDNISIPIVSLLTLTIPSLI